MTWRESRCNSHFFDNIVRKGEWEVRERGLVRKKRAGVE